MLKEVDHVLSVFILGHYRGNIPLQRLISPPQKNLRIRQKSVTCAAKSFQLLGRGLPPEPLNRGSAPRPRWGTSSRPSSSGVNQLVSVSGHPQFCLCGVKILCANVQKASLLGDFFPDPLLELCPWTTLGDFRSPNPQLP